MRSQSINVVKSPICLSRSLSEVQDWLKTVPTLSLEPVKCGNSSLDEPVVEAIEQAIQKTKVNINPNVLILYLIFVLRRQLIPPYWLRWLICRDMLYPFFPPVFVLLL